MEADCSAGAVRLREPCESSLVAPQSKRYRVRRLAIRQIARLRDQLTLYDDSSSRTWFSIPNAEQTSSANSLTCCGGFAPALTTCSKSSAVLTPDVYVGLQTFRRILEIDPD